MEQYIPKSALVAKIERMIKVLQNNPYENHKTICHLDSLKQSLYTLEVKDIAELCNHILDGDYGKFVEVKEADNMPNIRFPHYKSIVEKVFGAGNLESFEYDEVEQLVSLAKEELLKDLELKEVDLEKIINDYFKDWKFDDELDIMIKPNNYSASFTDLKDIAKHFFELGLKAQKGEEV